MPSEEVQFGRYLLQRKIATGGMAEIFLAKQQGPGRFERALVIKRILPHLAQDPKFIGMFLDEAALAAQLSHPHIAQLYDFGDEGGQYYLALELVRGPDLASIIAACQRLGRPPPVELSVRLVSQMLDALHYAHGAADEQGRPLHLVHRDVSPQNVLCSHSGVIKLIDFGIAKAASAVQKTEAGMVKGKFTYMAPEQLRGDPLDGRCDMYASALVLYELLTLQVALKGDGPAAIANALEARIEPLGQVRPDLPADLLAAVGRALERNRDARFVDCAEFGAALERVLASKGAMVLAPQIAEYLKDLETEVGARLSPVGLGSSSGEKVPSKSVGPGSGAHDTKISGSTAERAARGADATALSPPVSGQLASQVAAQRAKSNATGKSVAAVAVTLIALAASAAVGWQWYHAREISKAMADVVPEAPPVAEELPAVPSEPKVPKAPPPVPTVLSARVDSPVQPAHAALPDRRAHGGHLLPRRTDRPQKGKEEVAEAHPESAQNRTPPTPKPASTPTPNYRQVPPNYQQQAPYYQNGYYRNGYYQQQPGYQQYPYGQQYPYQQYPQQQYPQQQQGYQR